MFGNQQNRQAANAVAAAGESFTSNTEKRELRDTVPHSNEYCSFEDHSWNLFTYVGTLAGSGLGGLKAALAEEDKPSPVQKSPGNAMYEHETYSPYDKNYEWVYFSCQDNFFKS